MERWPIDLIHLHGLDFVSYLPPPGPPVLATLHLAPDHYPREALFPRRPDTWLGCVSTAQHSTCPPGMPLLDPIPNGVDLDAFRPRGKKRDFALCLGRICPEKGFHLAIDAAKAAGLPLAIGGEVFPYPAHQAYFETELRPRLDRHRRLLGPVGGERKRRLLAAARCLLVPSRLGERRGAWDVCDFEQLRPESPLLRAPVPAGWSEEVVPSIPCQVVDLPETFDGLHGRVSSRLLSNLRKFRRHLERLGTVEVRAADEASREEILETVIRLHTARWQGQGEAGVLADPRVRAFHREAAAGFQARGALILEELRLNGEVLAAIYGFRETGGTYLYAQGFEPAHARWSPGVLMVGAAVEEAIARGDRTCDFLRGREPYKEHWRPREAPTFRRRLRPAQSFA